MRGNARPWRLLLGKGRGVASVEFALVAIPFLTLLFLILGGGIQLFAFGAMDGGVQAVARQMRLGIIRGTTDASARSFICARMSGLASSCTALQINVISGTSFASLSPAVMQSNGLLSRTGYAPGGSGSYVLIQVGYDARTLFALPNALAPAFLSTVAFRNEP